jgi:S1-C subfamily serine protease
MKIRGLGLTLGLAMLAMAGSTPAARAAGPEDSIVKITSVLRVPNTVRPWTKLNPAEVGGTGVVIDGKRILTVAHLVTYAEEIYVQAGQGGDKVEAKVAAMAPGIDLAVLTIDPAEGEFFDKRPPLPRATGLPRVSARVEVKGFPLGVPTLSTTQGIVSRIEYAFFDTGSPGLRVQVDAAINPGNSGGPALVDGKMVGLVWGQAGAENVGYLIPNEEVDDFLKDIADGRYDGKPLPAEQWQTLENEALRAKLGLARPVRGIMVREPRRRDASYPLQEFDVVTAIGDKAIDNEGMIQIGDNLRLSFLYMVPKLARDGSVPIRVVRAGRTIDGRLPVSRDDDHLIRGYEGKTPSYFVCGSLVFSPVMREAVSTYYRANPGIMGRNSPLIIRSGDRVRFPGEELVVVTSPMLPHRMTRGYSEPIGQVIESVNGTRIKNLRHLAETIRDARDEFLTFRFGEDGAETLVFRRQAMLDATEPLMGQNGIPRRGSDDVMTALVTKPVVEPVAAHGNSVKGSGQ